VHKAKVAVYTCGLDIAQTETKGTVLLKKAEELLEFTRGEEKQLESVGDEDKFRKRTSFSVLNRSLPWTP
jgi:chaperonin GroEL (HSP60 family)